MSRKINLKIYEHFFPSVENNEEAGKVNIENSQTYSNTGNDKTCHESKSGTEQ